MLDDLLNWRYATKKMDPSKPVSKAQLDTILNAINLAPTSSGTQPFEVFVVSDKDVRAKLQKAAHGQSQIIDGSHVVVFAAWDNYTEARIDAVANHTISERPGTDEMVKGYFKNLKDSYLPRPASVNFDHAARQSYIALGFGLIAAAAEKVDATPMEGFDADQVNEILDLPSKGLGVTAIMALGHRDEKGDWLAPMKKVRRDKAKMFTHI